MHHTIRAALVLASFLPVLPATASASQSPVPPKTELTLAELGQRSDLWPARVALQKDLRFQGAAPLRKGQEVGCQELSGQMVVLDGGGFLFDLPVADTDFLQRARSLAASLTPEQLAVTWTTLPAQPELWPLRVRLNTAMGLADGREIGTDRELALRGFFGAEISVYDRVTAVHFTVEPRSTDLIARARERAKLPAKEREPFFVRALEASLEPAGAAASNGGTSSGGGAASSGASSSGGAATSGGERPLADTDFLLIYKARKGCGRCAAFTPELKAFYARAKAQYPRFELVFLSSDGNAADAQAYRAETQLPGRAVAFDRILEAADAASLPCRLLPGIFVVDRTGKVLEQNEVNGGSPGASEVLAHFEQRLKAASKPATR
ncbi:MAG: hypothetical protein HZA52_11930 [Planctomycetes bacterium]|nr:hypothetical protein [Planctomycetota bacterium]